MDKYKVGNIIECQVTGIEKYGIFVSIDAFYNGLIHISEISEGFVRSVSDYVAVGETIFARILEVDDDELKIKLSIKNINYKNDKGMPKVIETEEGFEPLREKLSEWIDEKLEEYKEK